MNPSKKSEEFNMLRGTGVIQTMPIQGIQHHSQKNIVSEKREGDKLKDATRPLLPAQIHTFKEAEKLLGITSVAQPAEALNPKVSQVQENWHSPDNTTFLTHYRSDYGVIFKHAIPLGNGGYAASGHRDSQTNPYGKLLILDGYGNSIHSKYILGSFNEFRNVIALNDETLVLPGTRYRSGFNYNMQTLFIGTDGSEMKIIDYGSSSPDKGLLVCKTPDNGFLNLGLLAWNNFDSHILIKADEDGNPLWHKTWSTMYPGRFSFSSISCSDSILLGGSKEGKEAVVKLTGDGDEDWIVTGEVGYVNSVFETTEQDILFCSNYGGNFKFGELNATGYLNWERKTNSTKESTCMSVLQTEDKKSVITGETNRELLKGTTFELSEYYLGNAFVEVFNDDQSHLWGGAYNEPSNSRFNSVQETLDGGLILAGAVEMEPGFEKEGVLSKVDFRNNNTECNFFDPFSINQISSWTDFSKVDYETGSYSLLSGEGDVSIYDLNTQDTNIKNCTVDLVTELPTSQPTNRPSFNPTNGPTGLPSGKPTGKPTNRPSTNPTNAPTGLPSGKPTGKPTNRPSSKPTNSPTGLPSGNPTGKPTNRPSSNPSSAPTGLPSGKPTSKPTNRPSSNPSSGPTGLPSGKPISKPTNRPSSNPTNGPTGLPSGKPTSKPTIHPSSNPTNGPIGLPSGKPTSKPTSRPSSNPTNRPSIYSSPNPTFIPSRGPSSSTPSIGSGSPSPFPTLASSYLTTIFPTAGQSPLQSFRPTGLPSYEPTGIGHSECGTIFDCTKDYAGEIALGIVATAGLIYATKKTIQAARWMCNWSNAEQNNRDQGVVSENEQHIEQSSAPIDTSGKYVLTTAVRESEANLTYCN